MTTIPQLAFGLFVRCAQCHALHFAVMFPDIRAGYLAQVTASEASELGRQRLTPLQVLARLSADGQAA